MRLAQHAALVPLVLGLSLLWPSVGCVVGQPHGLGKAASIVEPTTKRDYWLYLPAPYVSASDEERRARRWPLVVTFHGMKPFDNARWQAHEWEQEADRYGFIVIAPRLNAPDVLAEFPLKRVHPAMKRDEEATIAILDHVGRTTRADMSNVLSTGFSSGGYMAHYMLNRHPDRFTCLALRQANFSSSVLDASATGRSRHLPILVVYTENDMAICKAESQEAIQWYEKFAYPNIGWVKLKALGHVRTPDIAADFFGRAAGVSPLRTPAVLAQRQALAGNSKGMAFLMGKPAASTPVASREPTPRTGFSDGADPPPVTAGVPATSSGPRSELPPQIRSSPRAEPIARTSRPEPASDAVYASNDRRFDYSRAELGARQTPPRQPDPRLAGSTRTPSDRSRPAPRSPQADPRSAKRPAPQNRAVTPPRDFRYDYGDANEAIAIRVSSAIGIQPLHLGFWADCPRDWQRTANFAWTLNGQPVANGVNGQKTIADDGDHTLGLTVTTPDGKQYRTSRRIRVLPPAPSAYYTQARSG